MDQLRAASKWLLSWFKGEWYAADYPLRYRDQHSDPDFERMHGPLPRWNLQVVNWWQMGGLGETRAAAFADLEARLAELRGTGEPLPRPGRGLPLSFASSCTIDRHSEIARDLFSHILDLNFDECFTSDESSLFDFVSGESEANQLAERIEQRYEIRLADRERLLISEILEAIASGPAAV